MLPHFSINTHQHIFYLFPFGDRCFYDWARDPLHALTPNAVQTVMECQFKEGLCQAVINLEKNCVRDDKCLADIAKKDRNFLKKCGELFINFNFLFDHFAGYSFSLIYNCESLHTWWWFLFLSFLSWQDEYLSLKNGFSYAVNKNYNFFNVKINKIKYLDFSSQASPYQKKKKKIVMKLHKNYHTKKLDPLT